MMYSLLMMNMLKREKKSNMSSIISKIVADSNYKIEQFNQTEIDSVESLITTKTDKKAKKFTM